MPARSHYLYSLDRLERSHKNRMRSVRDVAHDIELVIHPVNEVHIRHSTSPIHRFGSLRSSAPVSMRSSVFRSAVSFDFNDLSRDACTVWTRYDQELTEQISSDREDIPTEVKLARQFSGFSYQYSLQAITTKMINPISTMPRRTHFCPTRMAILAPK